MPLADTVGGTECLYLLNLARIDVVVEETRRNFLAFVVVITEPF